MDTPNNQRDEPSKPNPFLNHDIATIIIAITFLSTVLSFIFNLSYFLSFNPSLLLMFSTSDYFSTGIYFVIIVVAAAALIGLSENYKSLFFSKKQFEKKKKEEIASKARIEKKAKVIKQLKNASSYEEILKKADDISKSIKRDLLLSRWSLQLLGIIVWILFAFPRVDWLTASIVLNAILSYAIILLRSRLKDSLGYNLIVFSSLIISMTFYVGAVSTAILPISQDNTRIVYEQGGKLSEVKGTIIRVLSRSLIVKTDQGFTVLDRETPLQIFYEKQKYGSDRSGLWWIINYFDT